MVDNSPKSIESKQSTLFNTTNTTTPQIIQINASHSLPLKLSPNNFASWYLQFDTLLIGLDLKGYVDGTFLCPASVTTAGSNPSPELAQWIRQDKLILNAIIASLTEPIVPVISQCSTSKEAMVKLSNQYASRTHSRVMSLKKRLTNCSQGGKTVSEFLNTIKSMSDELAMA